MNNKMNRVQAGDPEDKDGEKECKMREKLT